MHETVLEFDLPPNVLQLDGFVANSYQKETLLPNARNQIVHREAGRGFIADPIQGRGTQSEVKVGKKLSLAVTSLNLTDSKLAACFCLSKTPTLSLRLRSKGFSA